LFPEARILPTTPSAQDVTLAQFKALAGPDMNKSVRVHFNPASLQYTVTNTQDQQQKNAAGVQFVTQTTAKLTMDLLFDTTVDGKPPASGSSEKAPAAGEDVRVSTEKVAKLMRPYQDGGGKVPPSVEFSWGAYTFTGIVEQYKETLEFFSVDGVPLRASINLTLSSNSVVFESSNHPKAAVDGDLTPEPVVLPDTAGPNAAANRLGNPRAARAIAAASGSASLRFGGGASLAVAGRVNLAPPVAFSASGGIGLSAGAGVGIGVGAAAGLSIGATAGNAFAGLRAGVSTSTGGITNVQALLPTPSISVGGPAGFSLGGSARASGRGSLNADVGASADLNARIRFPD